jgi:hypothetical protein
VRIVSLLSRLTDDSSLARPRFERLIAAARAAGFPVRVRGTYRSPERQAYLMVLGRGPGPLDRVSAPGGGLRGRPIPAAEHPGTVVGLARVELAEAPLGFRSVDELPQAACK